MNLTIRPLIVTPTRHSFSILDGDADAAVVEVVVDDAGILIRVRLDDDLYTVRTDTGMS